MTIIIPFFVSSDRFVVSLSLGEISSVSIGQNYLSRKKIRQLINVGGGGGLFINGLSEACKNFSRHSEGWG